MFLGLSLLLLVGICHAEEWAVLVASSNTWQNYRHQSDVCHAYQIARRNGIPDERLIVMQFDDIARSRQNPFPGQIFNAPTAKGVAGVDVYKNVKLDYIGPNVTAEKFLAVITGDAATAGGKVLESTENDHVFINIVDHGATGVIEFPVGPYLTVEELRQAMQTMMDKKMFAQLTFYVEACEAGSMFTHMLSNESIYVSTASDAKSSSWATYCPPADLVDGRELNTCLGDIYSVCWMEDCDSQKTGLVETLEAQYELVKKEVLRGQPSQHVMQYGDLTFTNETVSQFLGDNPTPPNPATTTGKSVESNVRAREMGTVRSRDVPLHLAYYKYLRTDNTDLLARHAAAKELERLLDAQVKADNLFLELSIRVSGGTEAFYASSQLTSCGPCCSTSYKAFQQVCGGFDDYSWQYARVITNLCQRGYSENEILDALKVLCEKN